MNQKLLINMNSKRFRQIRKALNLTKVEMALELGISEKTIYNYEHVGKVPFCITLALITVCKKKGFEVASAVKLPAQIRKVSISGSVPNEVTQKAMKEDIKDSKRYNSFDEVLEDIS